MEIVLLDTNILIEILKGNPETIASVESLHAELVLSSISVMELYYGAKNKAELRKLEKFVSLFRVVEIDETISSTATQLVKRYAKSHTLDIPDSLIAATALKLGSGCRLFTYNRKDFKFIEGLTLVVGE